VERATVRVRESSFHVVMKISGPGRSALGKLLRVAGSQYGVVTRQQATVAGISVSTIERRLRCGEWKLLHRGVYVLPGFKTCWMQQLFGAWLAVGVGSVLCRRTSGALLRLEGIEQGPIEMYVPNTKKPRGSGIVICRTISLPSSDITRIGKLATTTATRTLIDLGSVATEEEVEIAFECAYRRGLTDPVRARRRLEDLCVRGRKGPAILRRILDLRGDEAPAGSTLEVKYARLARRGRLPRDARQWRVFDRDGLVARLDFAYPDVLLGIEVGGKGSHIGPAAEERDSRRHNRLTALGWRMLYFGWNDVVKRPDYVIRSVRSELARLRP
jgi:very-short-patch-repair endonuclease